MYVLEIYFLMYEINRLIYICDVCGQQFKIKIILLKYVNVYKEIVDYLCKFCDIVYRIFDGLKIYMIEVYMSEEQIKFCGLEIFKCEICDKVMV